MPDTLPRWHFTLIVLPTDADEDRVTDYLHLLKERHNTPSDSYFKHTVYGLHAVQG